MFQCFVLFFCDPEHSVMQINVTHRRARAEGAHSVLLSHKRYAHPLCELYGRLWFMSRLDLTFPFFFLMLRKGALDFNLACWPPRPSFINSVDGALFVPSLTQNRANRKRALSSGKAPGGLFL